MKKFRKLCVALCLLTTFGIPVLHAQSYDKLWKQVELAQKKSLPQSVIKLTEDIYRKGEREQNVPQMLKAYICREYFQEMLTPDSLYPRLEHLERWALSEKNPVDKAILHSLLAHEYASLMQANRRTLSSRTPLEIDEATTRDIREWTTEQFVDKIDAHNRAALQDSARLLAASAREYVPFIVLGEDSRFYRHDLYHLLAGRAVSTYRLWAGCQIDSLMNRRIRIVYEEMIHAYRQRTGAEDALLLCTLDYWEWRLSAESGNGPYAVSRMRKEQLNREHLKALDDLIRQFGDREVCAEVYIKKASCLYNTTEGRSLSGALEVCNEGLERYPSYKRINELKNLKEQILRPELRVNLCESGYPGDSVRLNVRFGRLPGFTLNLYATTLDEVPWMDHGIHKDTYRKYARKLSSTHFDLLPLPGEGKRPEDISYLPTDTVFGFKLPEETGVYILQVVPDVATARTEDLFLTTTRFKVLTLNLDDRRMEVVVLDALSGHPIADAKVSFYASYDERERKPVAEVVTGPDGKAVFPWQREIRSYVVHKGDDTAMRPQRLYPNTNYGYGGDACKTQLTLLTDRSLYRPGQVVYVKGIAYRQGSDSARVLPAADCELVLRDANRKELAFQKVRTNDFGSFTAEFVLPTACLNGMFDIYAKGSPAFDTRSSVSFRVEEYKRPNFEINFTPVSEAYRLGDRITLKGEVKAFNGMTVQNVPMAYTVIRRNARMGNWNRTDQPLLADTIRLGADGGFSISLTLDTPAGEGTDENDRHYTYRIEAAVTDEAGETQTALYELFASSEAYLLNARLPEYVCKEDSLFFTFDVHNRMNVPQAVEGTYRLYVATDAGRSRSAVFGNSPQQAVFTGKFIANQPQDCSAWSKLPSGNYRLELSVRDSLGREENNRRYSAGHFTLFSKSDTRPVVFADLFCHEENTEFDGQHPAVFFLSTSHEDVYMLMDVFYGNVRKESRVLHLNDTIVRMEYPYREEYGKGVTLLFSFVKGGEMYGRQVLLEKRQPERTLDMKWEVFRDRLHPGQEEEWKLVVKTPQGLPAAAELLATMYDASLDKLYRRNQFLRLSYPSYLYRPYRSTSSCSDNYFSVYFPLKNRTVPEWKYDSFYSPYLSSARAEANVIEYKTAMTRAMTGSVRASGAGNGMVEAEQAFDAALPAAAENLLLPEAELRTDFSETAFFYPQLRTNERGEVAFSFTMPQSLTRWNFRGYSHTKDMMTGMLNASAVTAKEFMLTPNMPRFVRVGDRTKIAATIANQTAKEMKGTVVFTLFDPMTEKVIATQRQKFSVDAGRTSSVGFHFEATGRYSMLGVRMVADGGTFSDGEQHLLPVLSDKEYITETLALSVRGEETRTFSLDSLFNRNACTATERRLTLELTGNPAWYAVQALPALSLPSTDNAVSWATAFYANSLAGYMAQSQPRIQMMIDSWKSVGGTKETFLSRLEKNQEVKNILLSESPWVLEAETETEQQARIATLFDVNRLNNRNHSAFTKLKELQGEDGGWSWYKGMSGSRYITGYITGLLVRLSLMTDDRLPSEAVEMKRKAFDFLHKQALEEYRRVRKVEKNGTKVTTISDVAMEYLYLVALGNEKVPAANEDAYRYFLSMVSRNLENGTMACKAQSATILLKAGRTSEANEFLASLKEHLVQTDEMGAHFAFFDSPYAWGMQPVSTHVNVMEALLLAGGNDALVEEMKLWLLQQKRTSAWNSPVATADAVYALLCRGGNWLDNRGDVRVTLGDNVLDTFSSPTNVVPGLGYVKETFTQGNTGLKAKSLTVEKRDAGIAWGAVYAGYLSPLSEVRQQGGELNVKKELYVERISASGKKTLHPVNGKDVLSVGDKVVTRLIIRLERGMDFIQLKDQRSACFEPMGTLSGYCRSNGFGYYMEVEDAATNFFFDRLGKGVYVLEHSCRIARGGTYETGLATVQCAYAPEYASHAVGGVVTVE